jgi:hypothetical protein
MHFSWFFVFMIWSTLAQSSRLDTSWWLILSCWYFGMLYRIFIIKIISSYKDMNLLYQIYATTILTLFPLFFMTSLVFARSFILLDQYLDQCHNITIYWTYDYLLLSNFHWNSQFFFLNHSFILTQWRLTLLTSRQSMKN